MVGSYPLGDSSRAMWRLFRAMWLFLDHVRVFFARDACFLAGLPMRPVLSKRRLPTFCGGPDKRKTVFCFNPPLGTALRVRVGSWIPTKTCFLDGYHLAAGLNGVRVTAGLQQNRILSAPTQGHHLRLSVGPFPHNMCGFSAWHHFTTHQRPFLSLEYSRPLTSLAPLPWGPRYSYSQHHFGVAVQV